MWSVVDGVANSLGGEAAKARVRPVGIVVHPPFLDPPASGRQIAEHVLVGTFVPEATIQALD